jgi:hypothetical protein
VLYSGARILTYCGSISVLLTARPRAKGAKKWVFGATEFGFFLDSRKYFEEEAGGDYARSGRPRPFF